MWYDDNLDCMDGNGDGKIFVGVWELMLWGRTGMGKYTETGWGRDKIHADEMRMGSVYFTVSLCSRDVREWLSTFPFPPIPIYSIPIPSHPHSHFLTYSYSHGIPVWAIPIPSHSHSGNAKVVYN